ncbi:hypothetical protein BAE44_0003009, partial [Dichanthelium oligosanthes]
MAATPPAPPARSGRNGSWPPSPSTESFSKFFESWITEQSRDLAALRAAADPTTPEADLRRLVDQVLGHYEQYYRTKAAAAANNVLGMFTPSWTSTTENLYLW